MSSQIAELSQRLQSALDQSYNVADMETVLHVISTLEKIQITKEQLETTRLGKYINHLRRKTTSESLARRAKNLLRKWREMVLPNLTSSVTPQQQQQQQPPQQPQLQQSEIITSTTRPSIATSPFAFPSMNKDVDVSAYGIADRLSHRNNASNYEYDSQIPSNRSIISVNQIDSSNHVANVVNQTEGCQQISKGRHGYDKPAGVFSNFSNTNKDSSSRVMDSYRAPSLINDNSRSPISISALPKIPKLKSSSSLLRSNKNIDRSHSPLVNLPEPCSSIKSFQRTMPAHIMHDDNSRHSHEHDARMLSLNTSTVANGRDAYNANCSVVIDNSSNSSTIHLYDKERVTIATNANQSNENLNSETKKKHKKHKKDKKSKKQKHQSSPVHTDRSLVNNVMPEISDNNLSNSSIGHLAESTVLSYKQQSKINENVLSSSFDALKSSVPPVMLKQSMDTAKCEDLTFAGKFGARKTDDQSIINIDSSSSSSSNSPKPDQMNLNRAKKPSSMDLGAASRSSSPTKMRVVLPTKSTEMGNIHAITDDEQSNHNILRHPASASIPNAYAENSCQDISMLNDVSNANIENNSVPSNLNELEKSAKKRGRKKGSKGVDGRLANASNSSKQQQGNAQYYDPISFSSLKNQIDLMRGTTKKVKTTKELLAELQNRKPATYNDDDNLIETPQPASIFDDKLNADLNEELDEIRSATPTPQKPSFKQSKKSKSSSKRRHSGDSIVEKEELTQKNNIEPKNNIDNDIQALRDQLPSIDKAELLKWQQSIENETIICTCKLIECVADNENSDFAQTDFGDNSNMKNQLPDDTEKNSIKPNVPTEKIALSNVSDQRRSLVAFDETRSALAKEDSTSSSTSTAGAQQPMSIQRPAPPPTKKVTVKSIFDLDYEEDDDPLTLQINHNNNDTSLLINNYNISSKCGSILNNNTKDKNSSNEISNDKKNKQNCDEVKFDSEAITNPTFSGVPLKSTESMSKNVEFPSMAGQSDDNDNGLLAAPSVRTQQLVDGVNKNSMAEMNELHTMNIDPNNLNTQSDLNEMPPQKRFRIEEDPQCQAMEYYVTSKQLITQFHVETLHQTFVPNVNGNWDNANGIDEPIENETTPSAANELCESKEIITAIDECGVEAKSDSGHKIDVDGDGSNETESMSDIGPHITEQSIDLYDRVVPLCNHLIMDRLPKNLSNTKIVVNESDEVDLHIFVSKIKSDVETAIVKNESFEQAEAIPKGNSIGNADAVNDDDFDELHWQKKQDSEVFAYHMEKIDCSAFERYRRHLHNANLLFSNDKSADCLADECDAAMDVDDANESDSKCNARNETIPSACDPIEKNGVDVIVSGDSNSSAANGSEAEKINVLPLMDDNVLVDINEGNNELISDMEMPNPDDAEMLPTTDENAASGYLSHLSESIETNHLSSKRVESNGDYYDNDSECQNSYDTDSHSEADSGVRWYMQDDQDPSYMDERSNFITLENFSQGTDDDDDDDNSGDDQPSDDDEDDIEIARIPEDGFADRVNRMYDSEFNDQLNRDQLLTNSEDADDIDPMLVCRSELGQVDKRSSGLDDDDNSLSDACSDGASSSADSEDSSLVECFKYAFKSRNGDCKISNKDNSHLRTRTDSPSIHSYSTSSSESSPYYNDRPCPTHYGQINPTHTSMAIDPIECDKEITMKESAGNRSNFEGIQSDPEDANSSPTESEAELVANFPPVVEIHQQHSQSVGEEDHIRNEDIPLECMLPEKLFQNEDSNDSCEQRNQTNDHEPKEEMPSIAESLEQKREPSAEQQEHPHDEKVMPEIHHHSDPDQSLPSSNNNRLPSFNNLGAENESGSKPNGEKFREWFEVVHIKSYNDELLTILPYVVID